ncbi:MAG TPA: ATP-binding protein [Candidatus Udaeobacter sp.]|nr:ATP-binding protein [Candidatus Udaeobacter sp.]
MNDDTHWLEANQQYLMHAIGRVRALLEGRATVRPATEGRADSPLAAEDGAHPATAGHPTTPPPALDTLCAAFGLSPFERDVLLLCAGIELDSKFVSLCATAHGDTTRAYPTFSLALGALPDPHWSALAPNAPLRRWRLVEVSNSNALTTSPLRIDERILHYLTGVSHLDDRLAGLVEPVGMAGELVPSQRVLVERVKQSWSNRKKISELPVVQLCGDESVTKHAIAAAACTSLGLNLHQILASSLSQDPREMDALIRLWQREAALSTSALLIDVHDMDGADAAHTSAVNRLIDHLTAPLLLSTRVRWKNTSRLMLTVDVSKPTADEQHALWQHVLGAHAASLNGKLDALVSQFDLSASSIRAAAMNGQSDERSPEWATLWDSCRMQTRPRLDDLAQRIQPLATWDELVLPDARRVTLREIAAHVRRRYQVYETWGFASKSARGLGISALFAGASGTGKTMATEVLANELRLDLYRIDLSQVVSKYIGETEKNLRRVFDAAEEGGAILLFDEADALFGKRSEVKDSHDRYANIEISYLLQRMEEYRGLAILTTNMKEALDSAFLRRIRFIVHFPFPDLAAREEIWRRIFPDQTPTEELAIDKLARLNVAGGNIRNIALNAAFLAADANEPVRMNHVLRAARTEYAKIEKPLTDAEIGGWQ